MTTIHVQWGEAKVKLTWNQDNKLPQQNLITSVHGFCFYKNKLMLVDLKHRGWDLPGGHIELNETPEQCFKRETLEEGCVEGECQLLGYMVVDHGDNPHWNESSPYPKVGYQVFYRMDISQIHPFKAEYESAQRIFIKPQDVSFYYQKWHAVFQKILDYASDLGK